MYNNQLVDHAFINSLISGPKVDSDFTNQQNYMMEDSHKLEECFNNINWKINENINDLNNIVYNIVIGLHYVCITIVL